MIILRRRLYSSNKILNTNLPGTGFIRGRKYDTDFDRLGRMNTAQRELSRVGDIGKEIRKMKSEVNLGVGKWQDTD